MLRTRGAYLNSRSLPASSSVTLVMTTREFMSWNRSKPSQSKSSHEAQPEQSQDHGLNPPEYDLQAASKTYNVSDLLLDLDAIDSPYTKSVSAPSRRQGRIAHKKGQRKFAIERQSNNWWNIKDRSLYKRRSVVATVPMKSDLMALTLLGNPFEPTTGSSASSSFLRLILRSNGIREVEFDRIKSFDALLRSLKTSEDGLDPYNLADDSHGRAHSSVLDLLDRSESLWEFRRFTDLISQTTEGCQLLATHGIDVVNALERIRSPVSYRQALTYLNNLNACMESRGVENGQDYCDASLYLAVKVGFLPAVRRYLEVFLHKEHPASLTLYEAMLAVRKSRGTETGWKPVDALRIITGWENGGVPGQDEVRKPSFALCTKDSLMMWSSYIMSLGKLGASEALWHEYSHPGRTPMPNVNKVDPMIASNNLHLFAFKASNSPYKRFVKRKIELLMKAWRQDAKTSKAELFIQAFMTAGDLPSALKCLPQADSHTGGRIFAQVVKEHHPNLTKDQFDVYAQAQLKKHYRQYGRNDKHEFTLQLVKSGFKHFGKIQRPLDKELSLVERLLGVRYVEHTGMEPHHVWKSDENNYSTASLKRAPGVLLNEAGLSMSERLTHTNDTL